MSEPTTLADALRSVIELAIARTFVSRPARVEAYDATKQTVDVTPVLKEVVEDDDGTTVVEMPLIQGVPVAFPRGGGFFVSFPIAVGDYVLLVVSDRSLDRWLANGGVVDPIDLRRHEIADAVAIPGVYPDPQALTEADAAKMIVGEDGGMQVQIDNTGNMVLAAVGAVTQAVALADDVKAELDALAADINSLKTVFSTWTPVATDGGAALKTAAATWYGSSLTMNPVGSSKVKAEE